MSDLTTDQEALQREIAQAIMDSSVGRKWLGRPDERANRFASAVLPIVTRREAALRERLELAEENTAEGADAAVRQAQAMAFTAQRDLATVEIEHAALVEKINALADAAEVLLSDFDSGAFGEVTTDPNVEELRFCLLRLRGLVSGDNQAVRNDR